ncbi:hypothetical protein MDV103 [Gallid alphaherpesvirus 2]|nr:hypothetical protein MDV081 [Gallid alphaherpesvirus 2]QOJ42226.1 hypothetical protein [synthetic construct]ABF72382.1 hypothetical protein MDV103 [Gallid alphaherpesvirus 2]ABR13185.1 hypothetical protein MDV081 [Gallid alphaherpesvirus 2]AEZ51760.1 hypothetical protein MDV081 [Gallid alphaherpesvirus 2]
MRGHVEGACAVGVFLFSAPRMRGHVEGACAVGVFLFSAPRMRGHVEGAFLISFRYPCVWHKFGGSSSIRFWNSIPITAGLSD